MASSLSYKFFLPIVSWSASESPLSASRSVVTCSVCEVISRSHFLISASISVVGSNYCTRFSGRLRCCECRSESCRESALLEAPRIAWACSSMRTPRLLNCFWLYACTGKMLRTCCSVTWENGPLPIRSEISCVFELRLTICGTPFRRNVTMTPPSSFNYGVVDELLPPHLHRGDVGAGVVHGLIAKTPTEVFEKG